MIQEKEFLKLGREIGIAKDILAISWENKGQNYSVFQIIADYKAKLSGSCMSPRPKPLLTPGYWECIDSIWVWIPLI